MCVKGQPWLKSLVPRARGGLKTKTKRWGQLGREEGEEWNAHFLNLGIHFVRITKGYISKRADRAVFEQKPGDPLHTVQTWSSCFTSLKGGRAGGWRPAFTLCNKVCDLWKTTHSLLLPPWPEAASASNLSICRSNKGLTLLCLEPYRCFRAKRETGSGGTDVGFALFYFQFKGRKLEQALMGVVYVFSKLGRRTFICSWESHQPAF